MKPGDQVKINRDRVPGTVREIPPGSVGTVIDVDGSMVEVRIPALRGDAWLGNAGWWLAARDLSVVERRVGRGQIIRLSSGAVVVPFHRASGELAAWSCVVVSGGGGMLAGGDNRCISTAMLEASELVAL